jgi:phosphomevalonate kinase
VSARTEPGSARQSPSRGGSGTLPGSPNTLITAPGKLFFAGEYGVLHGGTAVVVAVDRRVVARFVPGAVPSTLVVAEAIAAVRSHCTTTGASLPEGAPEIDSGSLSDGGQKLGLGSSAAVAAAAVGVLLEAAGFDVEAEKPLTFLLAERAHRAAQGGRGSGADVAAAVMGGVLAYTRPEVGAPSMRALVPPAQLVPVVVSTGIPSATVGHVTAVERLAARDPGAHARRLREIRRAADAFLLGYEAGDVRVVLQAVGAAHEALAALGRDADLPIVTPAVDAAAALARELGGAAKPSGAGGGDVGVAFFSDPHSAAAFRARVAPLNLRILSIITGAPGLRRET